ncbi:MAG: hypothetical protein H0X27_13370 [Caulobacteraceae bacterium]|nr:hypothetical protein [Caulobacteraceae bacterium]
MAKPALIASLLIPLLLAGIGARAADSEADKLREQLRATVLQLRELQDQQAAGAARPVAPLAAPAPDSSALKARLSAVQAQLRAARRDAGAKAALTAALDKAKADYAALSASASASQGELEKYKAALAQASDAGRAATQDRDRLQAALATQSNTASACLAKNIRLVAFAEDLLASYHKITLGKVLKGHEPVVGFWRVRLENIAQDREDQVRANRCDARTRAAAPVDPPPAGG